jgi:hypothetical protein
MQSDFYRSVIPFYSYLVISNYSIESVNLRNDYAYQEMIVDKNIRIYLKKSSFKADFDVQRFN